MELPEELWYRIIGYATDLDSPLRPDFDEHLLPPFGKESLKAKLALTMVSRSFCSICLPFLYESIVVESRESLQALGYTLVHCPAAKDRSSRVRMLRIVLKTFDMINPQGELYELMTQIINNTSNLKVFHLQQCKGQLFDQNIEFLAPRLPRSIQSLTWMVSCNDDDSRIALGRAISGCSGSLRVLSLDITHFTGSQSFSLESLTQLKLKSLHDREENLGDFLQRSAISHVITEALIVDNAQLSYPRITNFSVTNNVHCFIEELEHVFPNLEIFTFPTRRDGSWLHRLHHPSLQTIIFDNRGINAFSQFSLSDLAWMLLKENICAISLQRFPSIRSVTLKFPDDVFSGGIERLEMPSINWCTVDLRNAGILLEMEPYNASFLSSNE